MLGSCVDVIGTLDKTKPEIKVPIPFKLVGMHEALENNFDWIVPEIHLMKGVNLKMLREVLLKLILIKYKSLLRRPLVVILMLLHLKILDANYLSAPS